MSMCGIVFRDWLICGHSDTSLECLRPMGHDDPHLICREDGTYIAVQGDWDCNCVSCQSENADDWCEIFWEVSEKEAQRLLTTTNGVEL